MREFSAFYKAILSSVDPEEWRTFRRLREITRESCKKSSESLRAQVRDHHFPIALRSLEVNRLIESMAGRHRQDQREYRRTQAGTHALQSGIGIKTQKEMRGYALLNK